jgi:methylphosphotriester-DNA--protein-cysteine methyltransferase
MCPNSTEGAAYVGSVQSDPLKFHKVSCHHAARINAANRICFANRQVALDLGYVPCKTCKP